MASNNSQINKLQCGPPKIAEVGYVNLLSNSLSNVQIMHSNIQIMRTNIQHYKINIILRTL